MAIFDVNGVVFTLSKEQFLAEVWPELKAEILAELRADKVYAASMVAAQAPAARVQSARSSTSVAARAASKRS